MAKLKCSFCRSGELLEVKRIAAAHLIGRYRELFGVDVARYFPEEHVSTFRCMACDLRTHNPASPAESAFYDAMRVHSFYYEEDKDEFSYALEKIIEKRPGTLLDVGCGEGHFLRKLRGCINVYGSEYGHKAIDKLRGEGIGIDEGGRAYDFITLFQVLEHVPDPRGFLEEVADKLVSGGQLLITVPNVESKFFKEVPDVLDYPPHHMTQWSKRALENAASTLCMGVEDYYVEPLRIEHYNTLIYSRRERLLPPGLKGRLVRLLGAVADRVLAPYYLEQADMAGHTHGVLLKKK